MPAKPLRKTLVRHGNSLALVLDKPILELLQIGADTPLELTTNGNAIMLTPVREAAREALLRHTLEEINENFGEDLRRLAE
jgi:antitoxin component of MazEF toxin-antitoxin module